jgi:hypothetical protein
VLKYLKDILKICLRHRRSPLWFPPPPTKISVCATPKCSTQSNGTGCTPVHSRSVYKFALAAMHPSMMKGRLNMVDLKQGISCNYRHTNVEIARNEWQTHTHSTKMNSGKNRSASQKVCNSDNRWCTCKASWVRFTSIARSRRWLNTLSLSVFHSTIRAQLSQVKYFVIPFRTVFILKHF